MTVFLDTVGLLAVWDESDQWHRTAQDTYHVLGWDLPPMACLRKELTNMDTETSKTIEILRSSLVDCVNCLKVEQEKINILSLALKSLLGTKNEEAQHAIADLDFQGLYTLVNPSLDTVLEKLKAIPNAN